MFSPRPRSELIQACVGSDSGWHPPFRDEATEPGALVDREGGQKRREGIMAQLLNRLRAEERIAGVEFWHSPERCGWLMKQGTFLLLSRKKLSTHPPSLSRASTGRHGRKRPGSLPHSLADRSVPHLPAGEYIKTWRRRWFILKQGKIFWFKTEEVGPVSYLS